MPRTDHSLFFKDHIRSIVAIDDMALEHIIAQFSYRTIKKHEYLLQAGKICFHESFVCKGLLQVSLTAISGTDHILMFASEGWWASDLDSFRNRASSRSDIIALEDTTVLQINHADLQQLYQQFPIMERFFRILNENAFIAQQKRIGESLSLTAKQRFVQLQTHNPKLLQRISQKKIAQYLGITPEFLSQLRK